MKPTTTSVFVLPVHLQISQSQTVQGLSGCAAGAHRPCLLAAQDGQTKSITRMQGGSFARWSCHLFLGLLLSNVAYADNTKSNFIDQTPIHSKLTTQLAQTCQQTDNNQAPTMVIIRPGRFQMGSSINEVGHDTDEAPQHQVTIPHPFAISRCEITVGQFRQFVQESGYKTTAETNGKGCNIWNAEKKSWDRTVDNYWDKPGFAQTDNHPVVCVSWDDTQHYVEWLSQRTGALYRLPTEAEWEYAVRGDTLSPRFYQDTQQCEYANGLGQEGKSIADKDWTLADCTDSYVYTAPVASFAENPFGLFDMLGNALEWTLDCYHNDYTNAPIDGTAWLESDNGECGQRVVRGGSWNYNPQNLRSADRFRYDSDEADLNLGFRIARVL